MSAPDDGGPAYPSGKSEKTGYENTLPYYEGMTLRDWFAGQALAGYFAAPNTPHQGATGAAQYIWEMADAMLAARNNLP